jgi:class 3 adenylate cyclase
MSEPPSRQRRKLSAILMADVSGFSRMMETHEERTIALIQDFHRRMRELAERYEGRVVDTAGDSVFGEFDSVVNAVRCARQVQQDQAAANAGRPPEDRMDTRIGVHLGDVVVQDYQVYGDGVNIAARLEAIADPGGICISEAVYQQIQKKIELPVEDLGLLELKNIEHPVRVYRVPPLERAARSSVTPGTKSPRAAVPAKPQQVDWMDALRRPGVLVTGLIGVLLLASPLLLFPTGGVFPTAGSILLGQAIGWAWMESGGRRDLRFVPLGAGIAAGALWTHWSAVTNFLFIMAGLIVAALGVGRRAGSSSRED